MFGIVIDLINLFKKNVFEKYYLIFTLELVKITLTVD